MNDAPDIDTRRSAPAPRAKRSAEIVAGGASIGQFRAAGSADTFLGRRVTPLTRRRIDNFRANRRGFWSLWIFLALFGVTLFAELIANDRPLLIRYEGAFYLPVLHDYPETTFGGFLPSAADYSDPAVVKLISEKGWIIRPLIPFSYDTITSAPGPFPSPPS